MTHVFSFSGGRSSAYGSHLLEQLRISQGWDVHHVFMDTGAEHPATYEFIKNIVKYWGVKLTCLRVVYDPILYQANSYEIISVDDLRQDLEPWIGMLAKYGNPSLNMPFCTARMKTEPFKKYCDDTFGRGEYTTWLGIRSDEPKRLKQKDGIRYLAEISDFDKQDVMDWWSNQPFDLNIPEHLGNCVFCVKKHLVKLALAAKDEPHQAIKFIEIAESSEVRTEGRKHKHKRMYRNNHKLSDVIEIYDAIPRNELYQTLRSSKRFETGSCTESCESGLD